MSVDSEVGKHKGPAVDVRFAEETRHRKMETDLPVMESILVESHLVCKDVRPVSSAIAVVGRM
jgi:hypothetical protein